MFRTDGIGVETSWVEGISKQIPKVGELMTAAPKTIGADIPISTAKEFMKRDNFRHLPVLQGGRLVGIVSDRDIKVAESFHGPGELTIGEVMTPNPYVVGEEALEIARHAIGTATAVAQLVSVVAGAKR